MIFYIVFPKKHAIIWIELATEIKLNLQDQENTIKCIEKAVKICSASLKLKSSMNKKNNYPRKDQCLHPENMNFLNQQKA